MADNLLKIKLELDAGQFKAGAANAAGEAKVAFDGIAAKITGISFAFNQVSQAAGRIGGIYSAVMDPFKEAQADMAKVASLGVKNIDALNTAIWDIGRNKAIDLHDLRQGLYDVVSAGVDANYQIMVLDSSARAAKAGIAETSEALNLGAAVIKGYGTEWGVFETVMDKAFMTVNLGQTTFPELASAMGQVIPLAAALKINVNELFGAFATLTGVTGDTNQVATQLRAIMDGLASPTKQLIDLVKSHGYATVEDAAKTEGLAGLMKILAAATGGSATKMNEFFGRVEAVNAALALSTTQYDQMKTATDAVTKSTGEMNKAFEIQNKTLEAQEQIAKNRWKIIQEQLGKAVVPLVSKVAEGWTYILDIGRAAMEGKHWDAYASRTHNAVNDTNALAKSWDGAAQAAGKYANATGVSIPKPGAATTPALKTPEAVKIPYTFGEIGKRPEVGTSFDDVMKAEELRLENSFNQKLVSENDYYQAKIGIAQQAIDDIKDKDSLAAQEAIANKIQLEQDYANYKININQQAASAIGSLVTSVFELGKAGSYASAIVNTYEAATKALAGSIPPWNYIAMAGVLISGMAQVAKIEETEIEKRAGGGPVLSDYPYLIGERGPELFIPNKSGNIIPNSSFSGSGMNEIMDRMERMVSAVENHKIIIHANLDAIQFLRMNYPTYSRQETARSVE